MNKDWLTPMVSFSFDLLNSTIGEVFELIRKFVRFSSNYVVFTWCWFSIQQNQLGVVLLI